MDNVFEWLEKLNTTFPEQFAEIAHKLEVCDLESELDTVRSPIITIVLIRVIIQTLRIHFIHTCCETTKTF